VFEPTSKLKIVERRIDDVVILDLMGEITLDDGDLVFRRKVHALLDEGCRKILLNFDGVSKIDSAGVGMLATKLKMTREKHGDIKLVHLTPTISRLLGMMKILAYFEVFDAEEAAVRSFSQE
jgi:serine/threonine-protein kinase RsbW